MKGWTLRFHGKSRRDTLAEAKAFWETVGDVGLSWEEFRARLFFEEGSHEAVFVATAPPFWQVPPNGAVYGERPGEAKRGAEKGAGARRQAATKGARK